MSLLLLSLFFSEVFFLDEGRTFFLYIVRAYESINLEQLFIL